MPSPLLLDFSQFEFSIKPRRSRWHWSLSDHAGRLMMEGREKSRAAARYQSERALFLLLLASCRTAPAPDLSSPQLWTAWPRSHRPV